MLFRFIVTLGVCEYINLFVGVNAQNYNGAYQRNFQIYTDFSLYYCAETYNISMDAILGHFEVSSIPRFNIDDSPFIAHIYTDGLKTPSGVNLSIIKNQLDYEISFYLLDYRAFGYYNNTILQPTPRYNRGPQWEYFQRQLIEQNRRLYPALNEEEHREVAALRFEFINQDVIREIFKHLKKRVAKINWGFVGYPKCHGPNFDPNYGSVECEDQVRQDNDDLSWLWDLNPVLYPSIAVSYNMASQHYNYIVAILKESKRIAKKYSPPLKIIPYIYLEYIDKPDEFLSYSTLVEIIQALKNTKIDHLVIGCNSCSKRTEQSCNNIKFYLDTVVTNLITVMLALNEYRQYGLAMLEILQKLL